jgi:hypothetical protein
VSKVAKMVGGEGGHAGGGAEGVRALVVEPEGEAVGALETDPEPPMELVVVAPEVEPGEVVASAGWRLPEGDGVYTGVLWRPDGVREGAPITTLSVRFEDRSVGTHPVWCRSGGDEVVGGGGGWRRSGGTMWSDAWRSVATVALIGWWRFDAEDLEAQRKRW